MNSTSLLLLLAFAALAYCQKPTLKCASTWTGKSMDLPTCTTMSWYPEISKPCLQSEVLGYNQNLYTLDTTDSNKCLSVVIHSKEDATGAEETYVYRGPMNAFQLDTCENYCKGVRDAKQWFKDELQITLTTHYVGCMGALNNENLTAVIGNANTNFDCSADNKYAADTSALGTSQAERVPPMADNLKPVPNLLNVTYVTNTVKEEGESMPGWYLMSLGIQVAGLVVALGVFIYTIMLYVGVKNSGSVAPDFEMK